MHAVPRPDIKFGIALPALPSLGNYATVARHFAKVFPLKIQHAPRHPETVHHIELTLFQGNVSPKMGKAKSVRFRYHSRV